MIFNELLLTAGGDSIYSIRHYYFHFAIFALLIGYMLIKIFPKAYSAWQESLKAQVERGEKERELAAELLSKAQGKIATIPQAVVDLEKRLTNEAETESRVLIQNANKMVEEIKKRKDASIRAENLAASAALKEELSRLSLIQARSLIKESKINDQKLREDAFSGIGRLGMIQ